MMASTTSSSISVNPRGQAKSRRIIGLPFTVGNAVQSGFSTHGIDIVDIHARLVLYKRIASAETEEDLRKLKIEMIDRFCLLPDQVKALFAVTELKQHAEQLGIKKLEAHAAGGRILFGP